MANPKPHDEFRQQNQGGHNPQQQSGKQPTEQFRNPNQPNKGDERNPERNPGGSPGAAKHQGGQPGQKAEHRDPNAPKNPSVNNDADDAQRKSAYR